MDTKNQFSVTTWLIIIIASIGFLFDTYELLMTPLAAPPAIAELLDVPLNHPAVSLWTGRLLWITALCGGVFGLIGGALTDRLGRKFVMAAVTATGEAYLSHTRLRGRYVMRLAIGNIRTDERHVRRAWELVQQAARG